MKKNWIVAALAAAVMLSGCNKSEYTRLVEKELAKGERVDSLFTGLFLGMPSKDFFTHCWELNQKGVMWQGPTNTSVEMKMEGLQKEGKMNFFPVFHEDRIYELPVEISYLGWSPWNKSYSTDTLLMDVKRVMEDWYGPGFIEVKAPGEQTAYVKVDGNRRIALIRLNETMVKATYTDLLLEPTVKKLQKKAAK